METQETVVKRSASARCRKCGKFFRQSPDANDAPGVYCAKCWPAVCDGAAGLLANLMRDPVRIPASAGRHANIVGAPSEYGTAMEWSKETADQAEEASEFYITGPLRLSLMDLPASSGREGQRPCAGVCGSYAAGDGRYCMACQEEIETVKKSRQRRNEQAASWRLKRAEWRLRFEHWFDRIFGIDGWKLIKFVIAPLFFLAVLGQILMAIGRK